MSDYEQRISINVDGLTAQDLDGKILTVELSLEDIAGEAEEEAPLLDAGKLTPNHIHVNFPKQAGHKTLLDIINERLRNVDRYPGRGGW